VRAAKFDNETIWAQQKGLIIIQHAALMSRRRERALILYAHTLIYLYKMMMMMRVVDPPALLHTEGEYTNRPVEFCINAASCNTRLFREKCAAIRTMRAASGNLFCVRKDGNHAQLLRIDSTSMHRELYWLDVTGCSLH
jgi:hypothetical protein